MTESKKGRPTPKRNEAAQKRQALAPIIGKEEKKRAKDDAKNARIAARAAYMRGDESALPARDKGPARRFVRNFVDSRRSVGEYFLPVIFIVLLLTLIPGSRSADTSGTAKIPFTQVLSIAIMYAVLLISVIDGLILSRKIKKAVAEKYPDTSLRGLGMYGWLRSTQMRRMRTPKPAVKAGEKFN
ncbi:unannotated protein [freshwater metagenome]|uniref:Unannotated protein n=1 Tax=freshwater metagenome TaxID=449393 RepID=A0A6J7EXC0_9ZZZZ|nr:DUF3043 domain-containing protein [Actinomycetota bacterium]